MIFLVSPVGFTQDPQFSQFYAAPMYLNPAFTGNTIQYRIAGNYRNQWPAVPGAFVSYTFSYDQYLDQINSGVGLLVIRDKAGSGGLRFTNIGGLYSYKVELNRFLRLGFGVKASYTFRTLDFSRLHFPDEYLRESGVSTESPVGSAISYPDFSSGFVLFSNDFWLGSAFDHLNMPNQSLTGSITRLPVKYSLHGGREIPLSRSEKGNVTRSFILAAIYKGQQQWDQLDVGAYLKQSSLIFGLWYRGIPLLKAYRPGYQNNDAFIALAGVHINNYLHAGYSYDLTISKLTYRSGGTHEIAVIYEFSQPKYRQKSRRRKFVIPCAKF